MSDEKHGLGAVETNDSNYLKANTQYFIDFGQNVKTEKKPSDFNPAKMRTVVTLKVYTINGEETELEITETVVKEIKAVRGMLEKLRAKNPKGDWLSFVKINNSNQNNFRPQQK